MGNVIFYDLGKQEGKEVIYTIDEWKQLITAYDELEADNVALKECDLCDDPAEYHQCQTCMNDKLIGSHTDEEYEALQRQVEGLRKMARVGFKITTEEDLTIPTK